MLSKFQQFCNYYFTMNFSLSFVFYHWEVWLFDIWIDPEDKSYIFSILEINKLHKLGHLVDWNFIFFKIGKEWNGEFIFQLFNWFSSLKKDYSVHIREFGINKRIAPNTEIY